METWAWVLLGNPGAEYARTRHNLGRYVGEATATAQGQVGTPARTVRVFCPHTFMNLSGEAVAPWIGTCRA